MSYMCPDENKKQILCGGRFHLYAQRFDKIFSKLKEYGADLIFVNDGAGGKFKAEVWSKHQDLMYEEIVDIFDQIYDGDLLSVKSLKVIILSLIQIINYYGILEHCFIVKKYSKFERSY